MKTLHKIQRILMWIVFTLALIMFLTNLYNGGPGIILIMFGAMTLTMAFVILKHDE